jgi:sugar lactone lactonase YvrE
MEFAAVARGIYLEGLAVDEDIVWYSDVITGGIQRLTHNGKTDSWLAGRRWIGGILLNKGGIVLCSGPGGIAWVNPATGATDMLLDTIDGQPIDGVNEMLPDRKGGLYFGTLDLPAILRGQKTQPVALYRLSVDRKVTRLCDGLRFSNAMGLSPDGKTLYHNESFVGTFSYAVQPDGSLGPARPLLTKPDCDGMAVDVEGNLWISGFSSRELVRVQPDGTIADRVALPADAATNLRFGGHDGRDLYVSTVPGDAGAGIAVGKLPTRADSVLYRGRAPVTGQRLPRTQFNVGS